MKYDEIEKKGFSAPQNCILNNSKLRELGWRGIYSVKDGLRESFLILKSLSSDK